jgi:hypothetical protein
MKNFLKYLFLFFLPSVYGESIVIDANLDEAEWKNAEVVNEYYETVPFTLLPAKSKNRNKNYFK